MPNTFEQVTDETTTDAFVVVKKATINDSWTIHPSVFSTEAAATQAAQALVGNPDNYAKARVMLPDGPLFKDVE